MPPLRRCGLSNYVIQQSLNMLAGFHLELDLRSQNETFPARLPAFHRHGHESGLLRPKRRVGTLLASGSLEH